MRLDQILNMHIVANACAVWRWIIIAVHNQWRVASGGGAQTNWHQMRFGIVVLANAVQVIATSHVEVAQKNNAAIALRKRV